MFTELVITFLTGIAAGVVGTYNLLLAQFMALNSPCPVIYQATGTYVVPPPTSTMESTTVNCLVSFDPAMVASVGSIYCVAAAEGAESVRRYVANIGDLIQNFREIAFRLQEIGMRIDDEIVRRG